MNQHPFIAGSIASAQISAATIQLPPVPVGYFELARGARIQAFRKPCRFHRLTMRLVFGFKWVDA